MLPPFKAYDGKDDFAFISYARDDDKIIYPILLKLNEQGLRIWYDEGIKNSEEWRNILYNKIQKCSTFIALLTKQAFKKPRTYVEKEIMAAALEYNSRKLPVILAQLEKVEMPGGLKLEFIALQEDRSYAIFGEDYFIKHVSGSLDKTLWDRSIFSEKMNDIIQVFSASGEHLGTVKRKEIHEKMLWHKTVLVFVVHSSGKIIYIKRFGRSRINPNLIDCIGGHLKNMETYQEAAKREIAEELCISLDLIEDCNLIQIGEPGEFNGSYHYPIYENHEFSSLYLFFLSNDIIYNTYEDFGEDYVQLHQDGDFLEDLVKKYKQDKSQFADGISRILCKEKVIKEMKNLIEKQKISQLKKKNKN